MCAHREDRVGGDRGPGPSGPPPAGRGTIEHIGSAHDDGELEALKAAARQRLAAGKPETGDARATRSGPVGGWAWEPG